MGLFRIFVRLLTTNSRKPAYSKRRETAANYVEGAKWQQAAAVLKGRCWVIDGDTVVINKVCVRLAGIDAPELAHPWGRISKSALIELSRGQIVTAQIKPELSYDRVVAECFLPDGRDLAAEQVRRGLALDWPKFSGGKYRHLEPPDARRKLWRADARQKGRFRI